MKRLAISLVLLTCMLLTAAPGEAAPADTVAPADVSGTEVNTENGVYWAAITDTDRIQDGGFFTVRLYLQDQYPAEQVEALSENQKVRVDGQEYTVASIVRHDEETIEIYPREEFDGYIVFEKTSEQFYTALVNDWVPCTPVADRKVMLPLADGFAFLWIGAEEEETVFYADEFMGLLEEVELTQYNTLLYYSQGQVMTIIHASYPIGPERD